MRRSKHNQMPSNSEANAAYVRVMCKLLLSVILFVSAGTYCSHAVDKPSVVAAPGPAVSGSFSRLELRQFAGLQPIDSHTHVFEKSPAFYAMLKKLNLHILDIRVDDDTIPEYANFAKEARDAWAVVHASSGRIALCTTFNAYKFSQPGFSAEAIRELNEDFAHGAIAVKFYKVVGMEIKDSKGNYILPDNPVFEPIFKDIAAHNKTLIAHLADPDSAFEAPNPAAPDYEYLMQNPKLYMYGKIGAPTKPQILQARDCILDRNPNLRMVGAHLGSMESDFNQLGRHLDRYPNFAVDLAARMAYFEMQPRDKMIKFITKYQDRLIYGTDNEFYPAVPDTPKDWEDTYANDWRYLATNDIIFYRKKRVQGLALPQSILRKIYHDNAVKWFPGILGTSK
jgi:predicted TIM-barrel fold metal-dependent hydrolase